MLYLVAVTERKIHVSKGAADLHFISHAQRCLCFKWISFREQQKPQTLSLYRFSAIVLINVKNHKGLLNSNLQ